MYMCIGADIAALILQVKRENRTEQNGTELHYITSNAQYAPTLGTTDDTWDSYNGYFTRCPGLFACLFVCLLVCLFVCLFVAQQPTVGQGLLIHEDSGSHTNDAPQSVGLIWTSDQLVAETST